ncbi:thiamine pyrophosphate-binding protein [Nevskia sp.]|uniref:thiamine pyrophosphate-binding protein n=1 Tax=Nevskia sp. TaxID=1929292 RepID=UPI0025DC1557|nr:thiamine pyrophosphate-binding protein [Nevskia sp.]
MSPSPSPAALVTPPAPVDVTVADTILHYLKLEGARHVFGIPGGGLQNLLVNFKNARDEVRYVICRHETGAAYAADGYARISGGLGVVMVTTGPGATNALTGTMNADNDGSPLLTITGEVAQQFFGKGYLQEGTDFRLDVNRLYAASTDFSAMISTGSNAQELIEQALRIALGTPGRSTHLSLPDNVSLETLPAAGLAKATTRYRCGPGGIAASDVQRIAEILSRAKRPLVFLGNGCRKALAAGGLARLLAFVEQYQIPVITTADGKGIFPESHPLSLRVYGFASCQWPQYWMKPTLADPNAEPYDALLIIGSALGGLATHNWLPMIEPQGPIVQVDVDSRALGRGLPLALGVVGEAGALFDALPAAAAACTWSAADIEARRDFLAGIKRRFSPFVAPNDYKGKARPIKPPALIRVLQDALPDDAIVMLDSGNCVGWASHYFVIDPPRQIHPSLAMGPMGFGVGAVIGAKFAAPERVCLAVVGDGAFLMHGAEVSTAQAYRLGAIWVVLNDDDLHMVTQGMSILHPDPTDPKVYDGLYGLGKPDLVKFAEGLGADAHGIDSPDDLAAVMPAVLKAAAKGRPQVIVARIDRKQVPPYYNPAYLPPHA